MDSALYTNPPPGVHVLDPSSLDLREDSIIDAELQTPHPVKSVKNIWFFWNTGVSTIHPYALRTVRAYHRRFSKTGWTVRVLDLVPLSPLNICNYLDTTDPSIFPKAFIDGTVSGPYAPQHTSDLVRWPLLLKYGGIYADVGLMPIGDIDALWTKTLGDPSSGYEIISYSEPKSPNPSLTNYFMGCLPSNKFFTLCHQLFLALWAEDGGKDSTEGMRNSRLLAGTPIWQGTFSITEKDGTVIGPQEVREMLTDYIIQGQVITMVMGLVDAERDWNGPEYVRKYIHAMDMWPGSQLINSMTNWNGRWAFELMSQKLPQDGEEESEEQKKARSIVEECLKVSFGFKLAHGLILRVFGETLGSNWREHKGSDDVPGTYGHLLRYGMVHWVQDAAPPKMEFEVITPYKVGPLLRAK